MRIAVVATEMENVRDRVRATEMEKRKYKRESFRQKFYLEKIEILKNRAFTCVCVVKEVWEYFCTVLYN